MPKRVIDFDAMWGSDKLASCAVWAQVEYAWLYGLADASGCFEVTNLRVIWGRVAAIRGNFTIERLEQVFAEFEDKGLLFIWEHEGKRYAHWTGSDVPGRLPPPSWRVRMEKYAPPVPKQRLAEYMGRFARGRAAMGPAGFRGETGRGAEKLNGNLSFEISDLKEERETQNQKQTGNVEFEISDLQGRGDVVGAKGGIKGGVEDDQGQDWDLNLGLDWKLNGKWGEGAERRAEDSLPARAEGANWGREIVKSDSSCSKFRENARTTAGNDMVLNSSAMAKSNATANASANSNTTANAKALNRENSNANASFECNDNSRAKFFGSANVNANSERARCSCGKGKSDMTPIAETNLEFVAAGQMSAASGAQQRIFGMSAKELAVQRELRVGMGPVCGPARVRPEVLERIRLRELARAKAGTRSP